MSDYEPSLPWPTSLFYISLLVSSLSCFRHCAELKLNNFEIFLVRARVLLQLFIEIFQNSQNEHFNTRTYICRFMNEIFHYKENWHFCVKYHSIWYNQDSVQMSLRILSWIECFQNKYFNCLWELNSTIAILYYLVLFKIVGISYCESSGINCKKGNQ